MIKGDISLILFIKNVLYLYYGIKILTGSHNDKNFKLFITKLSPSGKGI